MILFVAAGVIPAIIPVVIPEKGESNKDIACGGSDVLSIIEASYGKGSGCHAVSSIDKVKERSVQDQIL